MLVSLLHGVLIVRALLRSLADRFAPGILLGALRLIMMMATTAMAFSRGMSVFFAGLSLTFPADKNASSFGTAVVLLLTVLGPALTFGIVWLAYRRFQDVPLAKEEAMQRPFRAWLPVGIIDACHVVVLLGGVMMQLSG